MKSNVKWRLVAVPVALMMLGIPAVGCDQLAGAADGICCKDFKVGADLGAVDWEIKGDGAATFSAFMQATADFAGTATASVTEVGSACQAIATDLGADPMGVKESDNAKRTTAWCTLAVAQIKNAQLAGKLVVVAQPPSCSFNASVQADCEAKCSATASCTAELGDIKARCTPGMLSGKCKAECTGTCEGSANLAVGCTGVCDGTCEGKCSGACSKGTGADCRGACDGTCTGECRGACKIDAGAKVTCQGDCTGGCSIDVAAPKCKAELTPPSAMCSGKAECSGSCKASASAKAECTAPSIEVQFTGTATVDTDLAVASLKLNLPKILVAFEGRGKILLENAKALADVTGSFVGNAKDLSVKAGLCAIPAGEALATAATNLQVTVTASSSVLTAVGM